MKFCPTCASALERKQIDGVDRAACAGPGCGFVHWDNPIPVVAVLVECAGGFVLARNARWPAGLFSIITGFLERGESPEAAAARETKEELGLDVGALVFLGHHAFPAANQLLLAFLARAEGTPAPGEEIAEIRLLSRDQLARFDFGRLELTARIVHDALKKGLAAT
jgi:NAD+ diphosphatase